eukprot:snap_masked-scaffold_11-processed-gene-1.11-mRNA-1 protein AED:1.00 eAED:1.00 QI:0/0/0/0/1/1/3/0/135
MEICLFELHGSSCRKNGSVVSLNFPIFSGHIGCGVFNLYPLGLSVFKKLLKLGSIICENTSHACLDLYIYFLYYCIRAAIMRFENASKIVMYYFSYLTDVGNAPTYLLVHIQNRIHVMVSPDYSTSKCDCSSDRT